MVSIRSLVWLASTQAITCVVGACFLGGCAVVLPPSGGPEDRTPPQVEECSLPPNATRVERQLTIEVSFSEYVERSDVEQSILVTPSAPHTLDWSGRTLTIRLDSLQLSTTYRLSISAGYRDLRGNRASNPFLLLFTTGERLDSCTLGGSLTAPQGSRLFALLIPTDTTSPVRYLVPVAADGRFTAAGLPCIQFTVAAFADANSNHTPDAGEDCAVAHHAVQARLDPLEEVRLWLRKPPTATPLEIISARAVSNRRIRVLLSRAPTSASPSQWQLVDRSETRTVALRAAFGAEQLELITADLLQPGHQYVLLPIAPIRDSLGNTLPDTAAIAIEGVSTNDSVALHIADVFPPHDTTRNESLRPLFRIRWSDAIAAAPVVQLIEPSSSSTLRLDVVRLDDATILAQPLDSLRPTTLYQWRLRLDSIRSWSGAPSTDTGMLVRTIITLDTRNGGSISGVVEDSCCQCRNRHVLVRSPRGDVLGTVAADSSGRFFISYLPEGNYELDAFCDDNGNRRYDAGSIDPLRPGERLAEEPVPVAVKARWQNTGIILRLQQ